MLTKIIKDKLKQNKKVEMSKIALIDFDGTIVDHAYPRVGNPMEMAFEVLNDMQKAGWLLVLWTCREGSYLTDAVEFCRANGIEFDSVNEVPIEWDFRENGIRRKPYAHLHIDDRNLGGFPGWKVVKDYLGV